MRRRWVLLSLFLVLLLFFVVRESREPFVWLFVDDVIRPKPPPVDVPLSDGLGVRLYASTQPHAGKVARLQKALVLTVDGSERIEEGFGFGLPLVLIGEQPYLSRSASVERIGGRLIKRYEMDIKDTPSGFLRRKYEPVPSIGTVAVAYTVVGNEIHVAVDFSGLEVDWDKVYLMNEQGARFFTRYEEPGLVIEGEEFSKWQPTTAREGCIVAQDRSVRFCVYTDEVLPRYYGRERYNQYYPVGIYVLSWAGIDLELEAPLRSLEYRVVVERLERE